MTSEPYGKGSFLIANPVLPDPNFSRTVVLLCNHNDEGSFGLVVNRKSDLTAAEIFGESKLLKYHEQEVFIGGPVSQSQVFYLCRTPEPIPQLETICPGIQLGMSWDVLEEIYPKMDNPLVQIRFYLGYSGWGMDQLNKEMKQKSWLTCNASEDFVFDSSDPLVWAKVVRSLGKEYEYLLTAPVDPSRN